MTANMAAKTELCISQLIAKLQKWGVDLDNINFRELLLRSCNHLEV